MSINKPSRSIVHCLVWECGNRSYSWTLVFECLLALSSSDQLIWEGSALHHVVILMCLPGNSELDVAFELAASATQLTFNLTTPVACPAPAVDEHKNLDFQS